MFAFADSLSSGGERSCATIGNRTSRVGHPVQSANIHHAPIDVNILDALPDGVLVVLVG